MASTIITKNSSTASAVPVVGDLTKGELAVNVTDKKIYTKDNSAAVVKLVGSLGNQEANAVAITGGSIAGITDLAVADGGTGASTASDARTNLGLGTIATQAASSVTITGGSVTGITDITVADGGTGASTAANARSNLGAAASGANSDITSLSGLTTALSVAQGGTGITSFGTGVATFLGTPSSANLLAAITDETGTGALVFANSPTLVTPALGTPASGNFSTGTFTWPTFNQNTTGTAAGLSATLAIASGGTGATTAGGALTSLGAYPASNPSGYTSNTGTVTSVGGTGTVNGLTLTGTVTTSGNLTLGGTLDLSSPPAIGGTTAAAGSFTTVNNSGGVRFNTSGSEYARMQLNSTNLELMAGTTTTAGITLNSSNVATLTNNPVLTAGTANGVTYLNGSKVLTSGSALTFDGTNLTVANGDLTISTNGKKLFVNYIANNSGTDLYIGSGNTIFTIAGSEQMRLTSTGLGIGTSSPTAKLNVAAANGLFGVANGNTAGGMKLQAFNAAGNADGYLAFEGFTKEYARFDSSGNLLVGTTSQIFSGKFCISSPLASTNSIALQNTSTQGAGQSFMYMANSAGNKAGSIDHSGTTTVAYTTSSDYRLKENVQPMTGALAKVQALNPVTYTWKEDGTSSQGFIAHELQAVVPECVVGEKDAVDEKGNPKYQGIDTSFLVATLTAALQELNAKFDAYKASHP